MATGTMMGIKMLPWSYSRLKDWERCPRYAYECHVNKNRGAPSQAMARGSLIHKQAEDYVNGTLKRLPASIAAHGAGLRVIRDTAQARAELRFGVTAKWELVDFMHKNAWGRGVIDLFFLPRPDEATVIEHKTGRQYPEHADQLRLYAVIGLALAPAVARARAQIWYFDLPPDNNVELIVSRKDAVAIQRDFERRVIKMAKDTRMLPRPNHLCKWCHLNRRNGGACDAAG